MKYAEHPYVGGHPVKREWLHAKACATCGHFTPCVFVIALDVWLCSTECRERYDAALTVEPRES